MVALSAAGIRKGIDAGVDTPKYKRIAVLMGGVSAERDVSLRSGAAVVKGLTEAGYTAFGVDVQERTLDLPAGIDAVFPALHGEFGEDGGVQTLLEAAGVPYAGSGPRASRDAFDKIRCKQVLAAAGVPTPDYELLRAGDRRMRTCPLVVKPPRQGSSIGVHIVLRETDWQAAFDDALRHDATVLVEDYIAGRELTVGVVGRSALPVVEIVASGGWYSFGAKYQDGRTAYHVPADVDPETERRCRELALATFDALGCRGFGRVDFRLAPDGRIYVLELNSLPGFTETSLLPKAAAAEGLSFARLCDTIIRTIP